MVLQGSDGNQTCGHSEGQLRWDKLSVALKHTLPHVKKIASGSLLYNIRELKPGVL